MAGFRLFFVGFGWLVVAFGCFPTDELIFEVAVEDVVLPFACILLSSPLLNDLTADSAGSVFALALFGAVPVLACLLLGAFFAGVRTVRGMVIFSWACLVAWLGTMLLILGGMSFFLLLASTFSDSSVLSGEAEERLVLPFWPVNDSLDSWE
jgi:hypothetical protein